MVCTQYSNPHYKPTVMLRTAYLLLSFLLITVLCFSQQKLAINGSSTAACAGSSNNNFCWVKLLTDYYVSIAQPVTLLNTAAFGENIYQCMPTGYVPPSGRPTPNTINNITNSLNWNPNVVLINYPSNWYDVWSVTEIMACYRRIRREVQMAGKLLFVTTTQPRTGFTASGRARLKEIKDSILDQFGNYAINFWDGIANPVDNTILPAYRYCCDDVHLNDVGHAILFERVRNKNIFSAGAPLSLQSATLSAKAMNGVVRLQAKVLGTDLLEIELQKSNNSSVFSKVETIQAAQQQDVTYDFEDKTPFTGTNYYRLKITEKGGRVLYSKITTVVINKDDLIIDKLFINGAGLQVYLQDYNHVTNYSYKVMVTDATGRLVQTKQFLITPVTPVQFSIPLSNFKAGVYILTIHGQKGETVTARFIIPF